MTDNTSEITPIDEKGGSLQSPKQAGEPDNSPGSQLRRAREEAGLSRRELSHRLCMIGNKLELLETDQYDRLPSALYVRGYIRSACKELKIDPQPVLEAFPGYSTAEEENREILAHVSRGTDLLERKRGLNWLALLPLLLVGGVFWWLNGRDAAPPAFMSDLQGFDSAPAEAEPAQTRAAVEQPSPDSDGTVTPESAEEAQETRQEPSGGEAAVEDTTATGEAATESAPVDGATDESGAASEPQIQPAPQDRPAEPQVQSAAQAQSPEPGAAAASGELQLSFDEESWVEVRDASGNLLLAKLKPAGSRAVLTGQPPFRVMLGNAGATQVRYRGQLIDSSPIGDRRTRRLTVGE